MRQAFGRAGLALLLLVAAAGCTSFRGHGVRTGLEAVPPVTDPQFARSLSGLLDAP